MESWKNSNIPRYPEIKTYGTTMVHLPSAGNSGRRQRTIEARHVGPVTILGAIQHIHESELWMMIPWSIDIYWYELNSMSFIFNLHEFCYSTYLKKYLKNFI